MSKDIFLEAKEEMLIDYIKEIAEILELKKIPSVEFCNGFTSEGQEALACIDIISWKIQVSRNYLRKMTIEQCKHTILHEMSHIFEEEHNPEFYRRLNELSAGTWKPTFTSGLIMINGNQRVIKHIPKEKEKSEIDDSVCNHYQHCDLTKDDVKLELCSTVCPYANECTAQKGYFCPRHIKPKRPGVGFNRRDVSSEGGHPCPEFAELDIKHEKEMYKKLAHKSFG